MMNQPLRIAVLFGGKSSEYEVSLRSAAFALQSLDPEKYTVVKIGITRAGAWKLYTGPEERIPSDEWDRPACTRPVFVRPGDPSEPLAVLQPDGQMSPLAVDVAFPVLHGKNGEDGTVQGLFLLAGVPCVGAETDASAVCMNKIFTHRVLDAAGIPNARWDYCDAAALDDFPALERRLVERLGYPMFVKPARAGSSVGVSKAHDAGELRTAIAAALVHDSRAVIEQTLVGREVECAVLGNDKLHAATPAEIESANEFYDYAAKYADIGSEVHIPPRISPAAQRAVRELAERTYRALLCCGLARVDTFVHADGGVTVNEINTLPGCTSISGYPKMMAYDGVDGPALCDALIRLAQENYEVRVER